MAREPAGNHTPKFQLQLYSKWAFRKVRGSGDVA